jgi:hypothetical protein
LVNQRLAPIVLAFAAVNERKPPRVATRQMVRYHVLEIDGQKLEMARIGTTLASDVAPGGVFMTHAQLTPGTHVHFSFELPGGYVEAVGKVLHNQHRIDATGVARPGAGVRFIRMSDGDRARLDQFLGGGRGGHRISEGARV